MSLPIALVIFMCLSKKWEELRAKTLEHKKMYKQLLFKYTDQSKNIPLLLFLLFQKYIIKKLINENNK